MKIMTRTAWPALILSLLAIGCTEQVPSPSRWTAHPDVSGSNRPNIRVAQRFRFGPDASEIGKNHRLVKSAFRSSVRDVTKATVRIYEGRQQIALGAVVDSTGLILTKASRLTNSPICRLASGKQMEVKQVSSDPVFDVALIKVDAGTELPSVEFADVDDLPVATWLATPSGVGSIPLAVGVVGLSARKIEQARALLGVGLSNTNQGVRIDEIHPHTGAARAKLAVGDLLVSLNGEAMTDHEDVRQRLRQMRPGDEVTLRVKRNERIEEIRAIMGRFSEAFQEHGETEINGDLSLRRSGFPRAIQHDTLLEPQHCGGPVVDLEGRVVGLNIARASRVASYMIPGSVMRELTDKLKAELLQETDDP